jgi:hypothetical protein
MDTYETLEVEAIFREEYDPVPVALWRGLTPITRFDDLTGDRIEVQLEGMLTTKLLIGQETMEVFPENFETSLETRRVRMGRFNIP